MLGWLVAPLGMLLVIAGTYSLGYVHGQESVQTAWDAANVQALEELRKKEASLQASMDKLREDKNRETAKLRRTVAALTDSLRDRPERPAVPASASAGDGPSGCTGAELYKPDSQFLVGESARADQIRLALKACQDAYQAASK